jgi:hypothetical protein
MLRPDDNLTLKVIEAAPKPPRTTNVVKINEYLDKLKGNPGPRSSPAERTPEEIKRALFHSIVLMLNKVSTKQRSTTLLTVTGMVMQELGIAESQTVKPIAVPDSFRVSRGRPRKAAKAA